MSYYVLTFFLTFPPMYIIIIYGIITYIKGSNAVYVAVTGSGSARVIQFRHDTRIPGTNKKKIRIVQTLGNYEKMLAEDPDILNKLREKARTLTEEQKISATPLNLEVTSSDIFSSGDVVPSFRFGHAIVKQLWSMMGMEEIFIQNCGKKNAGDVEQAIYYLTAHRCADPDSICASAMDQTSYAGVTPLGLDVFYDVLDILSDKKEAFIEHLSAFFERKTSRTGPEAYYDVTTYAFESTKWGELRMFGFSKDHKNNEVQVVMGLLIDNNGIPITYELFAGNTMDQSTLVKSVEKLKQIYRMDKITVVADRGLNGGNNLEYLCGEGHDFVISYTLKKSPLEFKNMVLDESGWTNLFDKDTGGLTYKYKVFDHDLQVKIPAGQDPQSAEERKKGRPRKYEIKSIPVKIHLTWSAKRAAKDCYDRDKIIEKLKKRLEKPYQLKAGLKRGCNQYLEMQIDTDNFTIDEEKITEAAKFDGYYAIITNDLSLDTEHVTDIYRGLWRIEESFRILKTDLRARPVFVWNDNHIKGHFALCFICLCMLRYAQYLFHEKKGIDLSAEQIMKCISDPIAVVQGVFPCCIVTPVCVPQTYLDLAELLYLSRLKTNMTLTNFRASTKLDLSVNFK